MKKQFFWQKLIYFFFNIPFKKRNLKTNYNKNKGMEIMKKEIEELFFEKLNTQDIKSVCSDLYNELYEYNIDEDMNERQKNIIMIFVIYKLYNRVYNEGDYAFFSLVEDGELYELKKSFELLHELYQKDLKEIDEMKKFLKKVLKIEDRFLLIDEKVEKGKLEEEEAENNKFEISEYLRYEFDEVEDVFFARIKTESIKKRKEINISKEIKVNKKI